MNAFLSFLLQAAACGSVVIVALLLLRRIAGSRIPPRWRYGLWLLALVCLLIPARIPSPASMLNAAPPVSEAIRAWEYIPNTAPQTPAALLASPQQLLPGGALLPEPQMKREGSPAAIVFVIWLAGALVTSAALLIVNIRFFSQVRDASRDAYAQSLCDHLRRELGIRRPVRVMLSNRIATPCLMGPGARVLIPPALTENPYALRHVLLHELCHLKQHDLFFAWLRNIALAVHWFNPLAWLAVRAVRQDSELSCDAAVLEHLSDEEAYDYGMTLLRLIKPSRPASGMLAVTAMSASRSKIRERIRMIAHKPRKRAVTGVLLAAVAIALAACTLTRAVDAPPPPSSAEPSPSATPITTASPSPSTIPATPEPTPVPDPVSALMEGVRSVDLRFFTDPGIVDNPNIRWENLEKTGGADLAANDRYEAALAAWKAGERPASPAPTEPYDTGFGIIPVREEAYGVDKLAFLPRRPLSDEEMMQFVDAMGGKELSELTTWQVLIAGQHQEANRSWTEDEIKRYTFSLLDAYKYDGRRSLTEFTSDPMSNDIAHISLNPKYTNGLEEVWLKPAYTMTDDQILAMIGYNMRNIPPEQYTPRDGDISDQRAQEEAVTLIEMLFDSEGFAVESIHASYSREIHEFGPSWFVDLKMGEGLYDYAVFLDAETGSLREATRLPKYDPIKDPYGDSYTMTPVEGSTGSPAYGANDPAIAEAAERFARERLLPTGVEIDSVRTAKDSVSRNMGECVDVTMDFSDGRKAVVAIALYDLSAAVVEIR